MLNLQTARYLQYQKILDVFALQYILSQPYYYYLVKHALECQKHKLNNNAHNQFFCRCIDANLFISTWVNIFYHNIFFLYFYIIMFKANSKTFIHKKYTPVKIFRVRTVRFWRSKRYPILPLF